MRHIMQTLSSIIHFAVAEIATDIDSDQDLVKWRLKECNSRQGYLLPKTDGRTVFQLTLVNVFNSNVSEAIGLRISHPRNLPLHPLGGDLQPQGGFVNNAFYIVA